MYADKRRCGGATRREGERYERFGYESILERYFKVLSPNRKLVGEIGCLLCLREEGQQLLS
jgi:hypothetical protein